MSLLKKKLIKSLLLIIFCTIISSCVISFRNHNFVAFGEEGPYEIKDREDWFRYWAPRVYLGSGAFFIVAEKFESKDLNPEAINALNEVKKLYYGEGREKRALALIENIIKKLPEDKLAVAMAHFLKGVIYINSFHDVTFGLESLEKAASISPDREIRLEVLFLLGETCDLIDTKRAISYYNEILKEDLSREWKFFFRVKMSFGFNCVRLGDFRNAMENLMDVYRTRVKLSGLRAKPTSNIEQLCKKYPIANQARYVHEECLEQYPQLGPECCDAFHLIIREYNKYQESITRYQKEREKGKRQVEKW